MLRLIIIGTGGFILPSLLALVESKWEIAAFVTMPIRTARKGSKAGIPPVREVIEKFSRPILEPVDINAPESVAMIVALDADLIFICDYGKILSKELIATTRLGGINLHGSLLPSYRGAAPIPRAIVAGEKEIGVSVIHITPEVDAGPILSQSSYFPTEEETAVEIEKRLAQMGVPLILAATAQLESGNITPLPQREELASKAPKLRKEEGKIDWSQSATSIINQYRAMQPWPGTHTTWQRTNQEPIRLIVGPFARLKDTDDIPVFPATGKALPPCGTILVVNKGNLVIQTGTDPLRILELKPPGKNTMTAEAFINGYRITPNSRFL